MPQEPRTPEQMQMFKEGLKCDPYVYASSRFLVLLITNNVEKVYPWHSRLWPLFEATLAVFAGNLVFDEVQIADYFVGAFFQSALASKVFTCGETDRPLVCRLFKEL